MKVLPFKESSMAHWESKPLEVFDLKGQLKNNDWTKKKVINLSLTTKLLAINPVVVL